MRIKALLIIAIITSLIFIWMCCGQNKTEWKGTVEMANGVTLVKNPKQGLWDLKENLGITMIQERQIGESEGPEEFLFDYIADVTVNSKGDIYVADRSLTEIRKFSQEGKYLLTIDVQWISGNWESNYITLRENS